MARDDSDGEEMEEGRKERRLKIERKREMKVGQLNTH